MDWNAKWDWENLIMFNSKTVESPKKQPTDWEIEEGEIDTVSFNLSGGGAVGSSSDLAHCSSARSSVSASMDSSSKEISKMSKIAVEAFHDFPEDFGKKNELARTELTGTSLPLEPSVGSGLTSSLSVIPVSSAASTAKKIKSSSQTHRPRCQVEGCNLDLSSAKEYHRKHRVCESHSKCATELLGDEFGIDAMSLGSIACDSVGRADRVIKLLSEQRRKKLQAKEAELRRREQDVYMYFRGSGKAVEMKREAAKRTMMAALP
ncbi:unnamed protein product [Camellia sinensis]